MRSGALALALALSTWQPAVGSRAAGLGADGPVADPDASEGVPIRMTPGDGSALGAAIAKAFVRPMLKVPDDGPTPPFEWGRYDVMGDGYGELVLSFRSPGQCSDAGCPLLVLRRRPDGSWSPIMAAVATSVAARRKGKVADILVAGAPGQRTTWVWDEAKRGMVASGGR